MLFRFLLKQGNDFIFLRKKLKWPNLLELKMVGAKLLFLALGINFNFSKRDLLHRHELLLLFLKSDALRYTEIAMGVKTTLSTTSILNLDTSHGERWFCQPKWRDVIPNKKN